MTVRQNTDSAENTVVIMPHDCREEYYIEQLGEIDPKPCYTFFKRVFDIVFSLMAAVILALPMLVIALLVKCTSPGNVLYYQERLGLNGKKIHVIKFRTMRMDAEAEGIQWSSGEKDPRVTDLGRILRATHLDELPQLWCILKGEMSLVGPRPEREVYYNEFEKYIHGFHERLKVKPGLTGLAQVKGGYHLAPQKKVQYDVEYIKSRSLWLDIRIILKTAVLMFDYGGVR